jgi:hypothetical protein
MWIRNGGHTLSRLFGHRLFGHRALQAFDGPGEALQEHGLIAGNWLVNDGMMA